LLKVSPEAVVVELWLNSVNPTFPVTKARNGPEVPNWSFGPNKPVKGRVRVDTVVLPTLPEFDPVLTVV
jgi:hypothetical protein